MEKQYGVSLANLNRLALMATKSKDSVVADSAFKRIGDSWDKEAWTTEVYFNQNKTWAAQIAPAEVRSRGILQESAANLQSEGGAQYQKNMEQAMLPLMRQCAQSSNDDQGKFELVVQVGKDGGTEACPGKAGVFSGRQTHRGKSQEPRSLDSEEEGNRISETYRQSHLSGW